MDSETFLCLKAGDEKAFKELFTEYSPGMLAFARRFVSEEMVYDVVQDTFLQVWNHKNQFNNICSIKSYLFTSVKNQCLNLLRNQHIQSAYLESLTEADFEEHMFDVEVYTLLYKAIEELPENYRRVIHDSLNGLHMEEIAREMNTSLEAVKGYKKRGKEMLKKKMKLLYGTSIMALIIDLYLLEL